MVRWSIGDLEAYAQRRTRTKLPASQPKHYATAALVKAKVREVKSVVRIGLRIIVYRCVLLDTDNSYGSTKQLTDCLCIIGLLPGDSPSQINLQVEQVKVATRKEQRTVVEIIYP